MLTVAPSLRRYSRSQEYYWHNLRGFTDITVVSSVGIVCVFVTHLREIRQTFVLILLFLMFHVWKPLSVSRVWNVRGTCLLAVLLLFFLHRHNDVTPSWFRALESYVLRVPAGNDEIKLWSSPSSLFTPSLLF